MILSKGAVNQNLLKLQNKCRIIPTYPFQKVDNYEPLVR